MKWIEKQIEEERMTGKRLDKYIAEVHQDSLVTAKLWDDLTKGVKNKQTRWLARVTSEDAAKAAGYDFSSLPRKLRKAWMDFYLAASAGVKPDAKTLALVEAHSQERSKGKK